MSSCSANEQQNSLLEQLFNIWQTFHVFTSCSTLTLVPPLFCLVSPRERFSLFSPSPVFPPLMTLDSIQTDLIWTKQFHVVVCLYLMSLCDVFLAESDFSTSSLFVTSFIWSWECVHPLGLLQVIAPEEIVDPNVDEHSVMTYLSQFPKSKLKPGAPLRAKTLHPKRAKAYGPGEQKTNVRPKTDQFKSTFISFKWNPAVCCSHFPAGKLLVFLKETKNVATVPAGTGWSLKDETFSQIISSSPDRKYLRTVL